MQAADVGGAVHALPQHPPFEAVKGAEVLQIFPGGQCGIESEGLRHDAAFRLDCPQVPVQVPPVDEHPSPVFSNDAGQDGYQCRFAGAVRP